MKRAILAMALMIVTAKAQALPKVLEQEPANVDIACVSENGKLQIDLSVRSNKLVKTVIGVEGQEVVRDESQQNHCEMEAFAPVELKYVLYFKCGFKANTKTGFSAMVRYKLAKDDQGVQEGAYSAEGIASYPWFSSNSDRGGILCQSKRAN